MTLCPQNNQLPWPTSILYYSPPGQNGYPRLPREVQVLSPKSINQGPPVPCYPSPLYLPQPHQPRTQDIYCQTFATRHASASQTGVKFPQPLIMSLATDNRPRRDCHRHSDRTDDDCGIDCGRGAMQASCRDGHISNKHGNAVDVIKIKGSQASLIESCGICSEDLDKKNDNCGLLECFHWYHYSCIAEWLTREAKCPFCQAEVKNLFMTCP